ncbi:hypothetical protein Hanom_Chr04g00317961 [Helianthus anomalus]
MKMEGKQRCATAGDQTVTGSGRRNSVQREGKQGVSAIVSRDKVFFACVDNVQRSNWE